MTKTTIFLSMVCALGLLAFADDRTTPASYSSGHTAPRQIIQKCPACESEIQVRRAENGEFRVSCTSCRQDMRVKEQNGRHTTFECDACAHRVEMSRMKDHRVSLQCPSCDFKMVLNCPECVEGKLKYSRFYSNGATMSCNKCHGEVNIRE